MESSRHSTWVYGLLLLAWTLVLGWQTAEHFRVQRAARAVLIERAKDISTTVGIVLRAQRRFGGVISRERLESALADLVKPGDLNGLALLNATGRVVVASGSLAGVDSTFGKSPSVRWDPQTVTVMNLVDLGTNVTHDIEPENPPIILSREDIPRPSETNRFERRPPPPPPDSELHANTNGMGPLMPDRSGPRNGRGESRFSRPPWMSESDYKTMLQKQGVHSFLIVLSTHAIQVASWQDFWLRGFIVFLATLAGLGAGLAWRNLSKSSELQLRLVRASELTAHAREMNLAAAGLAHETRNPLNIIRGMAQMIAKRPDAPAEIRDRSCAIVDEADKVAAQLNEFINYSRPREVRRTVIALQPAIQDVVQALGYDIEEKQIRVELNGEFFAIEADEQLLRQTLFNLLLNAIQALKPGGEIRVVAGRQSTTDGFLDICDNGPGVPAERRQEIFKPYFTTQPSGTGLGLAIVQQIVLAHGWSISCLPNEPQGAIFRIAHLNIVVKK